MAFTALDADQAAVFFDNPIRDRQPKSGPVVLGSEERGEDMREISLLDAAAGVGDVYSDKSFCLFFLLPDMKVRFYTGRDREASLPIHSLQAVFDQIKKDLGELRPIPLNRRQAGVKVFLDYDFALPKDLSLEEKEVVEEFMDVERNQIQVYGTREVQQLFDQDIHSIYFPNHDVCVFRQGRVASHRATQQLGGSLDSPQWIFDLVGQSGGERSEDCEAIGTLQILL